MARHLFFAMTLMGIGMLVNSQAGTVTDGPHCENNAANCMVPSGMWLEFGMAYSG
jgi:hypothetical protein